LYSSKTIQRKTKDITPLPKKAVTKGLTAENRTETMQKKVKEYNKILLTDQNYDYQETLLHEIEFPAKTWLDLKKNKNDDRAPAIQSLQLEAQKEKEKVQKQKENAKLGYGDKLKQNVVGDQLMEGVNATTTTMAAVKASGLLTPDEQMSFGKQTQTLVQGVNDSVKQGDNFAATEEISNLSEAYSASIKSSPVLAGLSSIGSLGVALYSLYDSYQIMNALGSAMKSENQIDVDAINWNDSPEKLEAQLQALSDKFNYDLILNNDQEVKKAAVYGYAKVKRRFYGAIYDVITNIISIIGKILLAAGVTAIAGAIIEVGKGVMDLVALTIRKIKGFYKILTGKRGVKRTLSAKTIVEAALMGNERSLELLVKLDPLGKALRWYGPGGDFGGLPKPQNNAEMLEFLNKTKTNPKRYGTTDTFITALAEQLKSF
jgi:hypothetical protein